MEWEEKQKLAIEANREQRREGGRINNHNIK